MRRRVSLPFAEWPATEQALWCATFEEAELGESGGAGASLRLVTRRIHEQHWGRWLLWLSNHGELGEAPAYTLLSKERGLALWSSIGTLAPNTQAMIFQTLEQCALWMAPDQDWRWLKPIRARIRHEQHRRRDKRPRLVDARRLAELGMVLMAQALGNATDLPVRHLTRYRDGLVIALLAACPLRLRNLTAIALDSHLRRKGDEYWLCFEEHEVKTGTTLEMPVPDWLADPLDEYLATIRPALLAGRRDDALWITKDGLPMPSWSVQKQIKMQTRKAFGHAINPHLFRDCAATSIAMEAPSRIRTAQDVLGHSSLKTTEEHYIHADRRRAVLSYHEVKRKLARRRRLYKEPP